MLSSLLLAAAVAGQCSQGRCPAPTRFSYSYAPAAVAAPAVYSLLDSSGRVWTHTDLAILKAHVARVNASLAADPAPAPTPGPNPGRPQVNVPPSPYVKPARPVVSATPDAAAGGPTLTDLDRKLTALEAEFRSNLCRCRVVEAAPPPTDFRFQ